MHSGGEGLSKSDINKLVKLKNAEKIKFVLVKYGIPFVPSFLLAFAVLVFAKGWINSFI